MVTCIRGESGSYGSLYVVTMMTMMQVTIGRKMLKPCSLQITFRSAIGASQDRTLTQSCQRKVSHGQSLDSKYPMVRALTQSISWSEPCQSIVSHASSTSCRYRVNVAPCSYRVNVAPCSYRVNVEGSGPPQLQGGGGGAPTRPATVEAFDITFLLQPTGKDVSHGRPGTESRPTSSLLGKFGSLKKKKHSVVETRTFTVQYLGQHGVSKVDGLDTVRPVVQVCPADL
jgi:hypothetical protein